MCGKCDSPGMAAIFFGEVDSTQSKVIEMLDAGSYVEDTFVVADVQRKGRGRRNTTWTSTEGCLTFSYATSGAVTMLNVLQNIRNTLKILGVETAVEWPNDIVLLGRKIGGVIVDVYSGFSIVGIGINLAGTMQYATMESLVGTRVAKGDFLRQYGGFYRDTNDAVLEPRQVWFESGVCELQRVENDCLVLVDGNGRELRIDPYTYSYRADLNAIVKKA